MFEKQIVIDGKGHMLGRLASVVAKELLSGQKIVVVRCEQIVMSGSLLRNKDKWARYRNKRHNTNPVRGPYHFRAPSKMFFRVVKGMIPGKTFRGKQALARLATFEGVPDDFGKVKRMVVPDALQVLVSKAYRKTTVLGTLASEVGWKHGELIKKLEAARIANNATFYAEKKADAKATAEAAKSVPAALNEELKGLGYYVEPTAPGAMKALKAEFATALPHAKGFNVPYNIMN